MVKLSSILIEICSMIAPAKEPITIFAKESSILLKFKKYPTIKHAIKNEMLPSKVLLLTNLTFPNLFPIKPAKASPNTEKKQAVIAIFFGNKRMIMSTEIKK